MTTKVIFRVDERDEEKEVIAVFPELAGTWNVNWDCLCYVHIGQHSSISLDFTQWTRPATPDEIEPLWDELVAIGYDDLKIAKRMTRGDLEKRKEQTRR